MVYFRVQRKEIEDAITSYTPAIKKINSTITPGDGICTILTNDEKISILLNNYIEKKVGLRNNPGFNLHIELEKSEPLLSEMYETFIKVRNIVSKNSIEITLYTAFMYNGRGYSVHKETIDPENFKDIVENKKTTVIYLAGQFGPDFQVEYVNIEEVDEKKKNKDKKSKKK